MRAGKRYANTWGLAGGKIEKGETVIGALHREIEEELGFAPPIERVIPIETFTSDNLQFCYHTFVCSVKNEFIPTLNYEHRGYCWTELDFYPKPLHPKVWNTFSFDVVREKIKLLEFTINF